MRPTAKAKTTDDPLRGTPFAKDEELRARLLPCARLVPAPTELDQLGVGASRLGGQPDLPRGSAWPTRRDGTRLAFLAQLAWADLARACPGAGLPGDGGLAFFYDAASQPWGGHASEFDAFRVLDWDGATKLVRVPSPDEDDFEARAVTARRAWSLPSSTALAEEGRAFDPRLPALRKKLGGLGGHRFLGHPDEIQGSMYGGFRGCLRPVAERTAINPFTREPMVFPGQTLDGVPAPIQKALRSSAPWRLLLQLDSDASLGWSWGDAGMLYFWIRESDLRARRFDLAWLVLQCG